MNKSRIGLLLEQFELSDIAVSIEKSFKKRLLELDFDGIQIADVTFGPEGQVLVVFTDFTGSELPVVFGVDDTDRPYAMPMFDEEEVITIDLAALTPPVEATPIGTMLRLTDLAWMNKSTMLTILAIGDLIGLEPVEVLPNETDAYGNVSLLSFDGCYLRPPAAMEGICLKKPLKTKFSESYQVIGRGLGKVRLPIVRKVQKMNLSKSQQHMLNNSKYKKNEKTVKALKVKKSSKKK